MRFSAPALQAAVDLSVRHLNDLYLPDKAIDVMDETGAAVRLRPGAKRRKVVGVRDVTEVVARMANIPAARASVSDVERLGNLEGDLQQVVYGQDSAIATVARAVKRARAGLGGVDRPIGCFLFTGPTGVGKTELSKQLAKTLGVPFLRFDMSEYMEKHAVARLIGAPPGYVGYDQGGQLVERIRKQPYTVLLLDEIEKAHQDLFDILLQVMDHATLTDNQGREADFRHVVLIMTSNVGTPGDDGQGDRLRRGARGRRLEGGRAPLQPGVPQPPGRDRALLGAHARGDGARGRQVREGAPGAARRAQGRARADGPRPHLARREGLRPGLRCPAPTWRA